MGKTLTAETGKLTTVRSDRAPLIKLFAIVAEHLKKPLYRLGAADLGSTIATVEDRLSETLVRCAAWDAILLIDEADVFLEARPTDSLERNELISSKSEYLGFLIVSLTDR